MKKRYYAMEEKLMNKKEETLKENSADNDNNHENSPDMLTYEEISKYLHTKSIGNKIIHFDSIDSTNNKAKELASTGEKEGVVVIAEEQTSGRGRLGRSFISPKYKGIWVSLILRPKLEPIYVPKISLIGAAAVNLAISDIGIRTYIKWPNDIVLCNKKVCGILTEMSAVSNRTNYAVIGIGINANIKENEFPEDLKDKAISLITVSGEKIIRKKLTALVLNHFEELYEELIKLGSIKNTIKICRKNSILLGKEIRLIKNGITQKATAIDINDDGELIVRYNNGIVDNIVSGEVSVRGLYEYV
jgi:BirA family biotin operon repressor/biotin-[acetyl-CoA-carboxylase] ligase